MKHGRTGRTFLASLSATVLLTAALGSLLAVGAAGQTMEAGPDAEMEHPVIGRWNVEAEPGGSVWAFGPSGLLVVDGPGELRAEGTWQPAEGEGAFDARVEVAVTGQLLSVLGQVAADGSAAALYVSASEATRPDDWTPWPPESRLVAPRFGMETGESPAPSAEPLECLRPEWSETGLDWDRCDEGLTAAATPEPQAG